MANKKTNKTVLKRIVKIFERCHDSKRDDGQEADGNWRANAAKGSKKDDVAGMRESVLPSVQYNMIELAHEAEKESTKLQAAQFVLEQAGHGVIEKVEHQVNYEKLPDDQLLALLKSKFAQLQKLNPNLSLEKLLAEKGHIMPPEAEIKSVEEVKSVEPVDIDAFISRLAAMHASKSV